MDQSQITKFISNILEEDTPEAADMRKILSKMIKAEMDYVMVNRKKSDCEKCKEI